MAAISCTVKGFFNLLYEKNTVCRAEGRIERGDKVGWDVVANRRGTGNDLSIALRRNQRVTTMHRVTELIINN